MKKKAFKISCGIICSLGFMVAIGSVGSIELGVVTVGQGIVRIFIGLALLGGAGYLGGFMR